MLRDWNGDVIALSRSISGFTQFGKELQNAGEKNTFFNMTKIASEDFEYNIYKYWIR